MINSFSFTPFPQIYFGEGEFLNLPKRLKGKAKHVLLLTGSHSIQKSGALDAFLEKLTEVNISYTTKVIDSEPSPKIINKTVSACKDKNIDMVIAAGGGSVLDAGKAIAAMMTLDKDITEFLEGVGTKSHPGTTLPFVAIPTTAGTGSEATKNAVITSVGKKGFKKSLRHDNFTPDIAVIDPTLMLSCPTNLTAACGLDAITQLLESYVSNNANPITDALAFGALEKVIPSFPFAVAEGTSNVKARADLAYGALISGITLANAGLGIVHGFASPMGGFFDIPHGVVCGTLLPAATKINIERLQEKTDDAHKERLRKHVKVARILPGTAKMTDEDALSFLVKIFQSWVDQFKVPRLRHYGIKEDDFKKIIKASSIKNNPVDLSKDDLRRILSERL